MFFKIILRILLYIIKYIYLCLSLLASKSKSKKNSSYILQSLIKTVSEVINKIGLKNILAISPDGRSYSMQDGIMLNNQGTNRYLKWRTNNCNEGYLMNQQITKYGIIPNTIMDIGGNFGEISLYFSKKYPKSKIYCIEGSPQNILILEDNLSIQNFSTSNIKLIKKIVSNKTGLVEITTDLCSENSIIFSKTLDGTKVSKGSVIVEAKTLLEICNELEIKEIDFLKIDIEGAEPLLEESLNVLLPNIKSMLVEFSEKNTFYSYEKLMRTIFSHNMICYRKQDDFNKYPTTLSQAIDSIKPNPKEKHNIDYFFIQEKLIEHDRFKKDNQIY